MEAKVGTTLLVGVLLWSSACASFVCKPCGSGTLDNPSEECTKRFGEVTEIMDAAECESAVPGFQKECNCIFEEVVTPSTAAPQPTAAIVTTAAPQPTAAIVAPGTAAPQPTAAIVTPGTAAPQPTAAIVAPGTAAPQPTAAIVTPGTAAPQPTAAIVLQPGGMTGTGTITGGVTNTPGGVTGKPGVGTGTGTISTNIGTAVACKAEFPDFCTFAECDGKMCIEAVGEIAGELEATESSNPDAVSKKSICQVLVAKCPTCEKCAASKLFLEDGKKREALDTRAPTIAALVGASFAAALAAMAVARRRPLPPLHEEASLVGGEGAEMAVVE